MTPTERRVRKRDLLNPSIFEIRAVFHRLWGSQVDLPTYKKRDWQELQKMIFGKFKVEL